MRRAGASGLSLALRRSRPRSAQYVPLRGNAQLAGYSSLLLVGGTQDKDIELSFDTTPIVGKSWEQACSGAENCVGLSVGRKTFNGQRSSAEALHLSDDAGRVDATGSQQLIGVAVREIGVRQAHNSNQWTALGFSQTQGDH